MRLRDIQTIGRMKLVDGNTKTVMPHQLTVPVKHLEEIDFAIEQLKKNGDQWQLREDENGEYSVYVNEPLNSTMR